MEEEKNMSVGQVDYKAVADRCLSANVFTDGNTGSKGSAVSAVAGIGGGAVAGGIIGTAMAVPVPVIGPLLGAVIGVAGGVSASLACKEAAERIKKDVPEGVPTRALLVFRSIKTEIIELAGDYGLTELEFEDLIRGTVNSKLTDGERLGKMMDLPDNDEGEAFRRGAVRALFEEDFQKTLASRPRV